MSNRKENINIEAYLRTVKLSRLAIVASFYLISCALLSQNEARIWYFGGNAGLDFSTNPPTVLTNGAMNTSEGCATISDSNGNLLFYTNGITIWDKTHSVMANGTGLFSDASSTQSSIIIKQPESASMYYVFTQGSPVGTLTGLYYSVVDMNLAGGTGSVTIKNVTVYSNSTEKLAATLHRNKSDVWILSHGWGDNQFRANLLTKTGIQPAILSNIGQQFINADYAGQMKISPDGKKIAAAISNSIVVYDFNNLDGTVSNILLLTNNIPFAYGCEFSSDSKKIYGASINASSIFQWDLCSKDVPTIIASQISIGTSTFAFPAAMQLAPNGKIYIGCPSIQSVSIINSPTVAGLGCGFTVQGQSLLTGVSNFGLPNFNSSYFFSNPILTVNAVGGYSLCSGESKTITVSGASTYTWNNNSTGPTITVSPTVNSSYTVEGTTSNGCIFNEVVDLSVSPCTSSGENFTKESELIVFPNPVTDLIHIQKPNLRDGQNLEVELFDSYGRIVLKKVIVTEEILNTTANLDVSFLPDGVYYLRSANSIYKRTPILISTEKK